MGAATGAGGAGGGGRHGGGGRRGVIAAGQGGLVMRALATMWGLSAMLTAFIVAFTLQAGPPASTCVHACMH